MKITDSENIKNIIIQKNQKTSNMGEKSFDGILDKKIKNLTTSEPDSKTTHPVHRASNVLLNPPIDRGEVVARVTEFLDVMEEYCIQLSSQKVSLKELAPLVSRMETETQNMVLLSESLPIGDSIKEILDETLIRSSVEVIKFNRGDYL